MAPPSAQALADARSLLQLLEVPAAVMEATLEAAAAGARRAPQGWRVAATAWGGTVLWSEHADFPRRWAHLDRAGQVHALLRWSDVPEGGTLQRGWLRLPGEAWLEIEPGTARSPLWGESDRLLLRRGWERHGEVSEIGVFEAQDFRRLDHIPPMDFPARLPPGAGSVALNVLAQLMTDQGARDVAYRGPYPTTRLFRSLLRSFACRTPPEQAARDFAARQAELAFSGAMVDSPVRWQPDPFEPLCPAPGLIANARRTVETVWVGEVPFRRADPGDPPLSGGERVWSETHAGETLYRVGLVMLGAPYRVFCTLGADATLRESHPPSAETPRALGDLHPLWRRVALAWTALRSTPALARAVLELEAALPLRWAPLPLSLAADREGAVCINAGLGEQFRRLAAHRAPEELALMAISDVLTAAAGLLRRHAQARMESRAHDADEAALVRDGEAAQARAQQTLERDLPQLAQAIVQGAGLPPAA